MKKLAMAVLAGAAVTAIVLFALWVSAPDPKFNPASFEDTELEPGLAPLGEAITLAQVKREDGRIATLLVTSLDGEKVEAIDLSSLASAYGPDPFATLAAIPEPRLRALPGRVDLGETYSVADLLPAAPVGDRHIGTGTNFPEHAAEASSDAVFMFPKFGKATPARTSVAMHDRMLLDYEVELCMRFDRPVASLADFDAATKGLFLCGDFTDRAKLTRLVDPDNLDSGKGFSDGKSGPDFYPSGAFLVIPRNWQSFVAQERFMTFVDGSPRQDARGSEMTLDFRELASKALGEMGQRRFLYRDALYQLAPGRSIDTDMTLMSGTAEGVIFTAPTRADIIEGGAGWFFSGGWLNGVDPINAIKERFIANERAGLHFLQPGQVVEHRSARLGTIVIKVESENGR